MQNKHIVSATHTGTFYNTIYQNTCTCGWKGSKVSVINDWYNTILYEEKCKHLKEHEREQ